MKKEVKVISLGGSVIVPEKIDLKFLKNFKEVINKNKFRYNFIIVSGGGTVARKYIDALRGLGLNKRFQGFLGISITRVNARFMSYVFGFDPGKGIPKTMLDIKKYLKKQNIVFSGALKYGVDETSDTASAKIAEHFKTDFINVTNVPGLYNKNPKKYKDAEFISKISWKDFYKMSNKIKFKPGQNFVLDQTASKIILRNKIKTYIIGKDLKQLDNLLNNKRFKGTIISD